MDQPAIFNNLTAKNIHMVGIKGTGMAALAEILLYRGAVVTGSDVKAKFYTDAILEKLKIPVVEGFAAANIPQNTHLVIYSTAYAKESNPDLIQAAKRGLPVLTYPEALGLFSALYESAGISGVHGKTTTTALAGIIAKQLALPAVVLAGSQVSGFHDRCTLCLGDKYFIAETCEYKAHFLQFHPALIIITTVELDHPDYFPDLEAVYRAFTAYSMQLPPAGILIYNADDPGVQEVIRRTKERRSDLNFVPYGTSAEGTFRITELSSRPGALLFRLQGLDCLFELRVPGAHNAWNATAAIALCYMLQQKAQGSVGADMITAMHIAVSSFAGSKRRSEILGEAGGILFMDDYAHHPTAVFKTLKGYREFFPHRRLVVDFMSHTYSRTLALLEEFGQCFEPADEVILHKIYSSAREANQTGFSGRDLYAKVKDKHPQVRYFEEFEPAIDYLKENLKKGDLFVTMGAGNNWEVGRALYGYFVH